MIKNKHILLRPIFLYLLLLSCNNNLVNYDSTIIDDSARNMSITSILLSLSEDSYISVKAHNVLGETVDMIYEGFLQAGFHSITWDTYELASGVYFISSYIGSEIITQKVTLLK